MTHADRVAASRRRQHLFASAEVGSRAATRVRIDCLVGSTFNGQRGIVARFCGDGDVMVRLDGHDRPLPFARSDLNVIEEIK